MGIHFRIDPDAVKRLSQDPEVAEMLEDVAERVVAMAQSLAPVDTGTLRDSIDWERDGDAIRVGSDVDYALDVEYGTSTMSAQPFLAPGLDAVKGSR